MVVVAVALPGIVHMTFEVPTCTANQSPKEVQWQVQPAIGSEDVDPAGQMWMGA